MIPSDDPFTHSIDMIEARLSRLENMHWNEETLPTQSLAFPDTSNHIDGNQESWYLEVMTKIQFHHKTLSLTNTNPLTNWQVFISMKLNLKMNVILIPNVMIQFHFLNLC